MTSLRLALYEQDLLDPDAAFELQERLAVRQAAPRTAAPRQTLPRSPRTAAPRAARRWRIPPPGMGWRSRLAAPSVMGEDSSDVRVGERFQIRIADRDDADQQVLVVLRRVGLGEWEVLSPVSPTRQTTLSQYRLDPSGDRQIDLLARGPAGPQRWVVAMVPAPLSVDYFQPPAERWASLQERLARGEVPTAAVDITVITGDTSTA